ncbi:uncharacterized protein At4g02000-like [Castanea sativa]|uniref:uncharacterized protein At4g02000-like n=1 Tax=Castanea sativa TaxID=21020 RepID=UPI003F64C8EF
MTVSNVNLDCASLWIQIWGAPFDMVTPQIAIEVGSLLGIVEDVERCKRQDTPNYFMRVRVALSISKPLRCGGFIVDLDGEHTWVNFKYERFPIFCHFCKQLGHDLNHCAYFVAKKNGGVVDFQYRDWLRACSGHQRSPP